MIEQERRERENVAKKIIYIVEKEWKNMFLFKIFCMCVQ